MASIDFPTRKVDTDDSGNATSGTVHGNAWLQDLQDKIVALVARDEGTFTPTIGGTTSQSGQTYTTQVGRYVKIGKLVVCNFIIVLSAKGTITGTVQIQGLPFTIENISGYNPATAIGYWSALTSSFVHIGIIGLPNTTTASLFGATAAATGLAGLAGSDLANTSAFEGTFMYRATS